MKVPSQQKQFFKKGKTMEIICCHHPVFDLVDHGMVSRGSIEQAHEIIVQINAQYPRTSSERVLGFYLQIKGRGSELARKVAEKLGKPGDVCQYINCESFYLNHEELSRLPKIIEELTAETPTFLFYGGSRNVLERYFHVAQ